MRNTKSAFTLVELIVVITILAILGTIAFISLQGYSADARNSKRTSDLNNITSSLNIKLTTGMGVMSAIADSTSALASVDLAG
jgi:prepilin-type N-terminal cleavage/methylation domain-containing protein